MEGSWKYVDYFTEILTEEEFDNLGDNEKRSDTIYYIVEE